MCSHCQNLFSRRQFLTRTGSAILGSSLVSLPLHFSPLSAAEKIRPCGPGSQYQAKLKVAFVRRKEAYGMWWPGQIYDGAAALKKYRHLILETGQQLGIKVDMRPEPIYSNEAADQWLNEARTQKPDGLLLVTLDRQQHTWPTVAKASESGLPVVVFSPVGSSFTTNTHAYVRKEGILIHSTDDFQPVARSMKMIQAGAKLREMRFLVIQGQERFDSALHQLGTRLRYIPAQHFIDEYQRLPMDATVKQLADNLIHNATGMQGPTTEDVYAGIKSYLVAKNLLEQEACDGISMDCLGSLAHKNISLPCISWSMMNDHGIPAACEADLGAMAMHALVQYLCDRPGFQQDPVAETTKECLIGAHCTCPTRLNGFDQPGETYALVNHHGKRDATARPLWKIGQRVTVADLVASEKDFLGYGPLKATHELSGDTTDLKTILIVSAGEVVDNISVPPAGGCVISVAVKLDGVTEYLDFPGFHQLFFYGDFKKELQQFGKLWRMKVRVV